MAGSWRMVLSIIFIWICCLILIPGICSPALAATGVSRGAAATVTTTAPVLVRPVITVTTTETTQPAVTCKAPCQCLLYSDAVAMWGGDGFIRCSDIPCASSTRTAAGRYCYQKKAEIISPVSVSTTPPVSTARVATNMGEVEPHQNPAPKPQPAQLSTQFQLPSQLDTGIHIETKPLTNNPTISVDPVRMPPTPQTLGGVVRVPVNVSSACNISFFAIQMSYWGASRVWLLDVEKGPLLQGQGTQLLWGTDVEIPYSTKKEAITILASSDNGVTGSGTLCYLTMWYHWDPTQEKNDGSLLQAIKEGAITVKGVDAQKKDGTHVAMGVQSARWYLSVDPVPAIDCNRDGIFDVADAMVVKQMADGLVMADLNCDADQNGKIDKSDQKILTDLLSSPAQVSKIGLL